MFIERSLVSRTISRGRHPEKNSEHRWRREKIASSVQQFRRSIAEHARSLNFWKPHRSMSSVSSSLLLSVTWKGRVRVYRGGRDSWYKNTLPVRVKSSAARRGNTGRTWPLAALSFVYIEYLSLSLCEFNFRLSGESKPEEREKEDHPKKHVFSLFFPFFFME